MKIPILFLIHEHQLKTIQLKTIEYIPSPQPVYPMSFTKLQFLSSFFLVSYKTVTKISRCEKTADKNVVKKEGQRS
jgi:hypothetical protein